MSEFISECTREAHKSKITAKQYTAGHFCKASSPKGYKNQQISDGENNLALLRCQLY